MDSVFLIVTNSKNYIQSDIDFANMTENRKSVGNSRQITSYTFLHRLSEDWIITKHNFQECYNVNVQFYKYVVYEPC